MRFCCEKMKFDTSVPSTTSPNIRIVKMLPLKGMKEDDELRIVYLTSGYSSFSLTTPKIPIKFCPFCGADLNLMLTKTDYHNEEEFVTF